MRLVHSAIVHCSASDLKKDDCVARMRLLHTGPTSQPIQWGEYSTMCRAWSDLAYHFIITQDGELHPGRPVEIIGAHCRGHNSGTLGICLTGDKYFTEAQFETLYQLCLHLNTKYNIPLSAIFPHSRFSKYKTCPNFDLEHLKASWPLQASGVDDL